MVRRKSTGEFRPEVIELLKTFATQSVLAIQNARLFREIEEKSQQIEAANRHKSEFLANMSHELRTPLNAIIGFSEVLQERLFGELNEKQAEYTDDILTSGRHLLSLINEILDLSKVEAGRMELEIATFDLPLAIDNARTFVRERATKHGINSTLQLTSGLATLSATSGRSSRYFSICFPTRSSSRRRAAGSGLTPGRPTVLWRYQSVTPASALRRRGPAKDLRGIPPGGLRLYTQGRGNRTGINVGQEVCRTAWRKDLGGERSRERQQVYVYAAYNREG